MSIQPLNLLLLNTDNNNLQEFGEIVTSLRRLPNCQLVECDTPEEAFTQLRTCECEVVIIRQTLEDRNLWRNVLTEAKRANGYAELIVIISDDMRGEKSGDVLISGAFAYFVYPFNTHVLVGNVEAAHRLVQERKLRAAFSHDVNNLSTVEDVASEMFLALKAFLTWDGITLTLLNDASKIINHEASFSLSIVDLTRSLVQSSYPKGSLNWTLLRPIQYDPLMQSIIESQKPLICPDILNNPPVGWDNSVPEVSKIRSWIGLPLIFNRRVIGISTLDSFTSNRYSYDTINQVALEQIANEAAAAINHAQQLEAQTRLEGAFKTIAEYGAPEKTFTSIAQQACELVGGLFSYVVRPRNSGNRRVLQFVSAWPQSYFEDLQRDVVNFDLDDPEQNLRGKKGITSLALERKKSVLLNDILGKTGVVDNDSEARDAYLQYLNETCSNLAVPITLADDVIGVINIEHEDPYAFTEEHLKAMLRFAEFAAIAINNNDLFQKGRFEQQKLESLFEASNAAISLDSDKVLFVIAEQACRASGAKWVSAFAVQNGVISKIGTSKQAPHSVDLTSGTRGAKGHTMYAMMNRIPVVISDIDHYNPEQYKDIEGKRIDPNPRMIEDGVKAALCLPMMFQEEVLGALWLHYETVQDFSPQEIEYIKLYVNHAAIVCRNAELYAQISAQASRLATLHKIGQAISAEHEQQQVLYRITQSAMELLNAKGSGIYEADPEKRVLRLVASLELGRLGRNVQIEYGQGLAGRVIEAPKLDLHIPDYDAWEDKIPGHAAEGILGSVIGIRLESEAFGRLGVLIVNDEVGRSYDDDRDLLLMLAGRASDHLGLVKLLETIKRTEPALDEKKVFVDISYAREFDNVFRAIQFASARYGLVAKRIKDEDDDNRLIVARMLEGIQSAAFFVADLTGERPNVYFELGFAMALDKPIIIIARKGETIHFDVQGFSRIEYMDTQELEEELAQRFAAEMSVDYEPRTK
jgi:GAF domain-containing protein